MTSCTQRRQIEQQCEKGLCIDCNGHKQFLRTGDSQSVSQNRRHFDTLGPSCNKPSSARRVYGLIATQTQAVLNSCNKDITMYLFWSPRGTIGSDSRDLYVRHHFLHSLQYSAICHEQCNLQFLRI